MQRHLAADWRWHHVTKAMQLSVESLHHQPPDLLHRPQHRAATTTQTGGPAPQLPGWADVHLSSAHQIYQHHRHRSTMYDHVPVPAYHVSPYTRLPCTTMSTGLPHIIMYQSTMYQSTMYHHKPVYHVSPCTGVPCITTFTSLPLINMYRSTMYRYHYVYRSTMYHHVPVYHLSTCSSLPCITIYRSTTYHHTPVYHVSPSAAVMFQMYKNTAIIKIT